MNKAMENRMNTATSLRSCLLWAGILFMIVNDPAPAFSAEHPTKPGKAATTTAVLPGTIRQEDGSRQELSLTIDAATATTRFTFHIPKSGCVSIQSRSKTKDKQNLEYNPYAKSHFSKRRIYFGYTLQA